MTIYANNPQSVINGFYSSSRNVFLTLSIGIAMYGFAESFKINKIKNIIKDISLFIFIFSLMLGLNNIQMFSNYIGKLEKEELNGNKLPAYIDLKAWKRYLYIKFYFILLLLFIITVAFVRLINRRFV